MKGEWNPVRSSVTDKELNANKWHEGKKDHRARTVLSSGSEENDLALGGDSGAVIRFATKNT